MKKHLLAVMLAALVGLSACTPATRALPPAEPLLFDVPYDTLFDATLQTMTTSFVSAPLGQRYTFAIEEADRDTGLISAVRRSQTSTAVSLRARGRYRYIDEYDDEYYDDFEGFRFSFGYGLPVRRVRTEQTIVTVVVRSVGEGTASLVYSSTSMGTGTSIGNRFMAQVVSELRTQFPAPTPEAQPAEQ